MSISRNSREANQVDAHMAGKFFHARTKAGLDLDMAATGLGISIRDYCAIEKGGCRVSASMVAKMSALTNERIKWFFDFVPPKRRCSARKSVFDQVGLPHNQVSPNLPAFLARTRYRAHD